MGSDIRIDSNLFENQQVCPVYVFYASSISISYNTLIYDLQDSVYQWKGIYADCADGSIVGNAVCQQNGKIENVIGIDLNYYGYYHTSAMQLVANNTIAVCGAKNVCGMYSEYSRNKIYHNTIRVNATVQPVALKVLNHIWVEVKNNILDAESGCPIWLLTPVFSDYNNYYSTTCVGHLAVDISSMSQWQQCVSDDRHSIQVRPQYQDTLRLMLDTNVEYACELLSDVHYDKAGQLRHAYTTMGAYQSNTSSIAADILEWIDFPQYVVSNQSVPVVLSVANTGIADITSISIGWSVNGVVQPSYMWIANTPLGSYQADTIVMGRFIVKMCVRLTIPLSKR